jgi:long-subunit acyl-CoA synthetase (AMP-forming)
MMAAQPGKVPSVAPGASLRGQLSIYERRSVRHVSYEQLAQDVEQALGRLRRAGVAPGACVGLMGENCYPWIVFDLALQALSCIPVCFPVDDFSRADFKALADAYDLSLLLVTQKIGDHGLPWVVVIDDADTTPARRARAVEDGELLRIARASDLCTVIFSSGTSGQLKALLLSRAGVDDVVDQLAGGWNIAPGDGVLVALPLSIFQQRILIYAALRKDADILFTDPASLFHSFKALRPSFVLAPPALFEAFENRHAETLREEHWRWRLSRALGLVPHRRLRERWRQKLFPQLTEDFGGRIRVLLTGSAPSKVSTLSLYEAAGMPLYQAYGLAEVGFVAWNKPHANRAMTVGRPVVEGAVTIADDEEIIVKMPHPQAIGYFRIDPAEAAAVFLGGGRVATGDRGAFDRDGYLSIIGRKKSLVLRQSGEKIAVEGLEAKLAAVPGVERAVVSGGGDLPWLVAIAGIDPQSDDASEERVRSAVKAVVALHNRDARPAERVERTLVTRVPFTPENGLLTRNLKLDRNAVRRYFEPELLTAGSAVSRERSA